MNIGDNWGVMNKSGKFLQRITIVPDFLTLEEVAVVFVIFLILFLSSFLIPSGITKIIYLIISAVISIISIVPSSKNNGKRLWKVVLLSFFRQPKQYKTENKNLMRNLMNMNK